MSDGSDSLLGGPLKLPGEPSRNIAPRRPKRHLPWKKISLAGGLVVLIAGLALGAVKLLGRKDTARPPTNQSAATDTAQPAESSQQTGSDVPDATELKTFKSDFPRVEFSYPSSWTVTENDNGVRIESPEFSYETIDAGKISGNFRVYIRTGARPADSAYIGRGVALEPSEKLTYSQPASSQRTETNLTLFGLDTSDHFAYFLIAGNFALQKNETLGPDYGKEPETYIITGGYSSEDLADDMATHKVPQNYAKQTKAYEQAINIIKSLKLL